MLTMDTNGGPKPELLFLNCPDPEGDGEHRMAYYLWENADTRDTLICVHGLTRNGRDFDFLAHELRDTYRIFCPDIPGRGKSEWLNNKDWYNYATYAADMMHFLEQRKVQEMTWIGTSMGGLIGMVMAALYPDRITRLVMNDIGPYIPQAALNRIGDYVGVDVAFDTMDEAEQYVRKILSPWEVGNDAHWRHITEFSFIEHEGKYIMAYDPAINAGFVSEDGEPLVTDDVEMWDVWNEVKCPVLVIRGAESDLLTRDTAELMVKDKDNAELIEFPKVGHAPALMNMEQMQPVIDWLEKTK